MKRTYVSKSDAHKLICAAYNGHLGDVEKVHRTITEVPSHCQIYVEFRPHSARLYHTNTARTVSWKIASLHLKAARELIYDKNPGPKVFSGKEAPNAD